jgi:phosphoribosylaminoimidazole-succinocarboxamide synthase
MNPGALFESNLRTLPLLHRGKVRDNYAIGDDRLLIVASDRLSAFDVVLPDPIPGKGAVLTAISNFWFAKTRHLVANHLTGEPVSKYVTDPAERAPLEGRAVVVKRLRPLPVEAVVRGYLIGSGWKDYRKTGAVCGIALPPGLAQAAKLPTPVFTPSTKAAAGQHDENVPFTEVERAIGAAHAARVRELALALYGFAADYARARGILIADT